jgi:hypothetical protein
MVRKLKLLGLLLTALTAANAVTAVAASAKVGEFTATKYEALLDGTKVKGEPNALTIGAYEVECETSTFSARLKKASTELTVTPAYANCQAAGLAVTAIGNGCGYLFHLGEGSGDSWPSTVDIECPPGKSFEVRVFLGGDPGPEVCKFQIPEQKGSSGQTWIDHTATETIELTGSFKNLTYQQEGLCGKEQGTAVRDITALFQGTTLEGNANGLVID